MKTLARLLPLAVLLLASTAASWAGTEMNPPSYNTATGPISNPYPPYAPAPYYAGPPPPYYYYPPPGPYYYGPPAYYGYYGPGVAIYAPGIFFGLHGRGRR